MSDGTPLRNLEDAIQQFINAKAEAGDGSPGLVTDFFLAVGYTRIDEDGDQPYSRTYAASASPFGAIGVAELTLSDARNDLGCNEDGDDE